MYILNNYIKTITQVYIKSHFLNTVLRNFGWKSLHIYNRKAHLYILLQ